MSLCAFHFGVQAALMSNAYANLELVILFNTIHLNQNDMKNLLYLIAFFVCSNNFGQIQNVKQLEVIGTIKPKRTISAELSYIIQDDSDTLYTIMFRNRKYDYILRMQSIHFSGHDGTLQSLYTICKSVFSDENKTKKDYKVQFKLGGEQVIVSNKGMSSLMFSTEKGYFYLTDRQVDRLFGKKE